MRIEELAGKPCIADNKFYGRYLGTIIGLHEKNKLNTTRILVKIEKCLRKPSTLPELVPYGHVKRQEYLPGEIHHFDIGEVSLLAGDSRAATAADSSIAWSGEEYVETLARKE
mgnify:FL=1